MSLLQQDSQNLDDAARGEEFTKGSSHVFVASVIAVVAVSIAVFLYVRLGEKPPPAAGEVGSVVAHMMHRETSGFDAAGAAMQKDVFEQVLVFAHAKLHNQSKQPLFLHEITANVEMNDGVHSSYVAVPTDYERAFQAYSELAPLHGKALPTDATVEAGQTMEGDLLASFRMTKEEWDARKGLNFSFAFKYQPNLVLTPIGPVTEQAAQPASPGQPTK